MGEIATVLQWAELVKEIAIPLGLEPALVLAIIWIESNGTPNAFNPKSKATGLMQVMPYEGGSMFCLRPGIEELREPRTNIKWGCKILKNLLSREEQDLPDGSQGLERALYLYSGGRSWKKYDAFMMQYWEPLQFKRTVIEGVLKVQRKRNG